MCFLSKGRIFTAVRTVTLWATLPFAIHTSAEVENLVPPEAEVSTITNVDEQNPLGSTITYPGSYFSHYDPVTALDILTRIPGLDSVLNGGGSGGRGLGAGNSPILIDGKRIAGKANSGTEVLGRIAAKQVSYVEIIRGSSAELDVRTDGPIVNIVMKEGASRSSLAAEINATHYGDTLRPGGSLAAGGQTGDLNYLASITAKPFYERQELRESGRYIDGRTNRMKQVRLREQMDYELAGNFSYAFSASDLLQLNAFYLENSNPHTLERNRSTFDGANSESIWQWEERESDRGKWELGGNYQHSLGGGDRFNLIFVVNESIDDWYYDRFEKQGDMSTENKVLYIGEDKRSRERILRSSFNLGLGSEQDVELGIEGAQTTLDKQFRLGVSGEGEGAFRFGGLQPANDVDSLVEEIRVEPFIIHNWQLTPEATLESTLVAEFSEISQVGSNNGRQLDQSRDFKFFKPKVDYRYDLSSSTQFRATLERYVSQLSFANFTASSDGDLDKNVNAGNPNLEQQKSWRYELRMEHRLPDDAGVFNTRLFYHDIEDVIDRVDVSPDANRLVSAPGNIGDGERYGLEMDASLRLLPLDLPDALLTVGALVQDSAVMDPFLEQERRLRGQGRGDLSVGFRHDVPAWNLNYGADYKHYFQGGETDVDIEDVQERFRPAETSLYVEKVAFGGVIFRLESSNLLEGERCYERTRYLGPTAGGVVEEVENYCFAYGRETALTVKTTF